jgi:hypothetical protein
LTNGRPVAAQSGEDRLSFVLAQSFASNIWSDAVTLAERLAISQENGIDRQATKQRRGHRKKPIM